MRLVRSIAWLAAVAMIAAAIGCGGSATRRDARRLEKRCGVLRGEAVTEEQARCIAKIFGIRDERRCPMEVDRPDGFGGPAYRVTESCNGLGVVILESTGRVVALVSGDEILYD